MSKLIDEAKEAYSTYKANKNRCSNQTSRSGFLPGEGTYYFCGFSKLRDVYIPGAETPCTLSDMKDCPFLNDPDLKVNLNNTENRNKAKEVVDWINENSVRPEHRMGWISELIENNAFLIWKNKWQEKLKEWKIE
jgi:hypothetical protein